MIERPRAVAAAEAMTEIGVTPMKSKMPDVADLRKILSVDFATGRMTWLPRPDAMFSSNRYCKSWNDRWQGKDAFASKNMHGYHQGRIFGKKMEAHRVIWAMFHGEWPNGNIDHINGVRSDNRIDNMRDVTKAENSRNSKRFSNNTSGMAGIGRIRNGTAWRAFACDKTRKYKHLGNFRCFGEAVKARNAYRLSNGYTPESGIR